jgi:hypothetical protein
MVGSSSRSAIGEGGRMCIYRVLRVRGGTRRRRHLASREQIANRTTHAPRTRCVPESRMNSFLAPAFTWLGYVLCVVERQHCIGGLQLVCRLFN